MPEVAEMRGSDAADAAFDLLIEESASVSMIVHWSDEEDVIHGMRHPLQVAGSGGKPHPGLCGTFARVLGPYVYEKKALTLEEALRRMTGASAQLLRLKDRRLPPEGCRADVVVFDPHAVTDRAIYEDTWREPEGIHHVMVNAEVAVGDGSYTGVTAGEVLRRG